MSSTFNNNHTYLDEVNGWDVSILVLGYENGWICEVCMSKDGVNLPRYRDTSTCYPTKEDAKNAGLAWAKSMV